MKIHIMYAFLFCFVFVVMHRIESEWIVNIILELHSVTKVWQSIDRIYLDIKYYSELKYGKFHLNTEHIEIVYRISLSLHQSDVFK